MTEAIRRFPCQKCGADVEYAPGVGLKCPFCGAEQGEPESEDQIIEEMDFATQLTRSPKGYDLPASRQVRCQGCGATSTYGSEQVGTRCPYCDAPVVVEEAKDEVIRPEAVIPFAVARDQVADKFRAWVRGRWFAPNALQRVIETERIQGVYRPYFTFDAATQSFYEGERGEHYYETEHYTDSEGKRQTRQVQKTRWHPARGTVRHFFDDVLVSAGRNLDWDTRFELSGLKPYAAGYLAGWQAERGTVSLDDGFAKAKVIMDAAIRDLVEEDIGGDEQRVHGVKTSYNAVRFKHVLLPLFVSSYAYGGKTYRFQANGQTGEVTGQRPYSFFKILFFVLALLALLIALVAIAGGLGAERRSVLDPSVITAPGRVVAAADGPPLVCALSFHPWASSRRGCGYAATAGGRGSRRRSIRVHRSAWCGAIAPSAWRPFCACRARTASRLAMGTHGSRGARHA